MTVPKVVERVVVQQVLQTVAHLVYAAGLTALIPILPILFYPGKLFELWFAFGFAVVLILLSFFLVFIFTRSKKQAFFSLGLMTLIPGLFAVVVAYIGERRMQLIFSDLGIITPFVTSWIDSYVPKTWFLAGIYIILGVILVWASQD